MKRPTKAAVAAADRAAAAAFLKGMDFVNQLIVLLRSDKPLDRRSRKALADFLEAENEAAPTPRRR